MVHYAIGFDSRAITATFDPRKARDIPDEHYQRIIETRDAIQNKYSKETDLGRILFRVEGNRAGKHDPRPRVFFSDYNGNVLTTDKRSNFQLRAMQNFVTSIEDYNKPKQRLYGRYMIAGPVPIVLADSELLMYVGFKWNEPPPLLLRLFDHPFQLLLAVMLVSTPLLLWLAWALSQPARRLEAAAQRVAKVSSSSIRILKKAPQNFVKRAAASTKWSKR